MVPQIDRAARKYPLCIPGLLSYRAGPHRFPLSIVLQPVLTTSDNGNVIDLVEKIPNSGIYESDELLLVSSDDDDVYTEGQTSADNQPFDVTQKAALGDDFTVKFPATGNPSLEESLNVKLEYTVDVIPVILLKSNDEPAISATRVNNVHMVTAREILAQTGIQLNWSYPRIVAQPATVDLDTYGLTVRDSVTATTLSSEFENLITLEGTKGNTSDIHVFFVNEVWVGQGIEQIQGHAVADWFYNSSEEPYTYNVVLDEIDYKGLTGYAIAHEILHLLGLEHVHEEWNVMHNPIRLKNLPEDPDPRDSKRITNSQESEIKNDISHVHPAL